MTWGFGRSLGATGKTYGGDVSTGGVLAIVYVVRGDPVPKIRRELSAPLVHGGVRMFFVSPCPAGPAAAEPGNTPQRDAGARRDRVLRGGCPCTLSSHVGAIPSGGRQLSVRREAASGALGHGRSRSLLHEPAARAGPARNMLLCWTSPIGQNCRARAYALNASMAAALAARSFSMKA